MKILNRFWKWWYQYHPKPSKYTRAEALAIAKRYNLEYGVITAMEHGCTPDEALQDWDIYPNESDV